MISKRLILLFLLVAACKPAQQPAGAKKTGEPQVRATVVSVRTVSSASNETRAHQIVIANGIARNTGERDIWRLFDTTKNTVTTVDDVSRTFSVEPLDVLVKRQRAVLRERTPAKVATLEYEVTGEKRTMFGATAVRAIATAGKYTRELWIAEHPAIPKNLYRMMQASAPPTSPLAPAGAELDRALLEVDGFPLVDKYELPFGTSKRFAGERTVVGIAVRDVPRSVLAIPRDYRDVTPKPPAPRKTSRR